MVVTKMCHNRCLQVLAARAYVFLVFFGCVVTADACTPYQGRGMAGFSGPLRPGSEWHSEPH